MLPRARLKICCVTILCVGFSVWVIVDRVAHPLPPLTEDEQSRLEKLIENHEFTFELHLNESGLPYLISTIDPEAHALFRQKPLSFLNFLRGEVAKRGPDESLRAATIALAAGEDSYDARFYYSMKQDYDDFDTTFGNTRRGELLKMIDNRMERVALAAHEMTERAGRRDRGTLGRDRHLEAHPEAEVVIVDLVQTNRGEGYWMR